MLYIGEDKDGAGKFYYDLDNGKIFYGPNTRDLTEQKKQSLQTLQGLADQGAFQPDERFSIALNKEQMSKASPAAPESMSGEMKELMAMQETRKQPAKARPLSEADKDEIVKTGGGSVDPSATAMTQISGKSAEDVYADQMKIAQGKDLAIKMGIPMTISAGIDLANLVMPTETEKKLQESIDALAGEDTDAEADKFERDSTQQMRAAITEARQREEARSAALGGERLTAAGDIQRGREASRDAMARGVTDIRERANRMRSEAATDVERRRLSAELQKASIADQKRQQFLQGLTSSGALLASAVAGVPMEGPASPETLAELGLTADQYSRVMAVLGQNKFRTKEDAYLALQKAGMKPSAILKILESDKLVR